MMDGTAREGLLRLADALPPGGSVTLDATALRRLAGVALEEEAVGEHAGPGPIADLTCEEAGQELGRAPSTIRTWCGRQDIPGAYRLRGREWRIPRASLRQFLDRQAACEAATPDDNVGPVDLGAWRAFYPRRGGGAR